MYSYFIGSKVVKSPNKRIKPFALLTGTLLASRPLSKRRCLMKFTLPGQLKGPECKVVMAVAIKLRKLLEPLFKEVNSKAVKELCIILRVNGSLGSFGISGLENIELSKIPTALLAVGWFRCAPGSD